MKSSIPFFTLLLSLIILADNKAQVVYQLWEGEEKPHYKENNLKEYEKEAWGTIAVDNVTEPTLTIYQPKGANTGKAVIVIPGGGYELVAMYHEGYEVAKELANRGVTAAVLKYRLPKTESSDEPHLVPLSDARKALKLLRSKAKEYGFAQEKVGVMGFSAGSHLATVAGLWKSVDTSENPNFSALIYGVTNLKPTNQKWLENNLYHRPLTEEEVAQNTLLDLVSASTPPAFLAHAYNDQMCHITESTLYAEALFKHEVPVEMHLFAKGGHGFGVGKKEDGTDQWLPLFINWLKTL